MKSLKIMCLLVCIIMLCSCVNQHEMNLDEFIAKTNIEAEILPDSDTFRIYRDGEFYRYSHLLNQHTMLSFYSYSDGNIRRITLTSDKPDEQYLNLRPVLLSVFTEKSENECSEIISQAETKVNVSTEIYTAAVIKSGEAETFMISYSNDEINTNEYPTLKKHINEKDVSRPTAGTEKTTTEK